MCLASSSVSLRSLSRTAAASSSPPALGGGRADDQEAMYSWKGIFNTHQVRTLLLNFLNPYNLQRERLLEVNPGEDVPCACAVVSVVPGRGEGDDGHVLQTVVLQHNGDVVQDFP